MGGRLLPNARGAHWFLKAPASKKPTDISHPAEREPRAWNPIDSGPPRARQILVFVQSLMFGEALHARVCANPNATHEPKRGLTRLMSTGIVGSNPCGVIPDTSSAAAAQSLPLRPSSLVLNFPPPAPRRRRSRAARRWSTARSRATACRWLRPRAATR
jgi:hypothetical protein